LNERELCLTLRNAKLPQVSTSTYNSNVRISDLPIRNRPTVKTANETNNP